VIEFTKKKMMGSTVYLSKEVTLPYSTVKQSNIQVEQFAIVKNKETNIFEVGVWDTVLSKYNTAIFSDCNSPKLHDTVRKVSEKVKLLSR